MKATLRWQIVPWTMFALMMVFAIVVGLVNTAAQGTRASEGLLRELRMQLMKECRPVFEDIDRCAGSLADYSETKCPGGRETLHRLICGAEPGIPGSYMLVIEPGEGPVQKK
jgi:hypothetical protein